MSFKTTNWKNISAGVPQGRILRHIFDLLYTADIPINYVSITTRFADDMSILTSSKD